MRLRLAALWAIGAPLKHHNKTNSKQGKREGAYNRGAYTRIFYGFTGRWVCNRGALSSGGLWSYTDDIKSEGIARMEEINCFAAKVWTCRPCRRWFRFFLIKSELRGKKKGNLFEICYFENC